MKLAADIMTRNPFTLSSSMQIDFAAKSMIEHHISTAPVLDTHRQILGQVSEVAILKSYIIAAKKENNKKVLFDVKEHFIKPLTVKETDGLDVVVKQMLTSSVNRILVLDDRKHLVGVISPKDILRFLVGEEARSGTMLQEMEILQDRIAILKDELSTTKAELSNIDNLVQQSAFMFYSADANGKILVANDKLSQTLGYASKELVGKFMYDLYDTTQEKMAEDFLQKIIASKVPQKMYSTYVTKAGNHIRMEIVATAIRNTAGKFIATSTISRVLDSDMLLRALHGIYDNEEEL